MRADLGWTYVEAGALNTANGAGYIVGALVAAWTANRWGTARAFLAGFSVNVLVLLLTAATTSFSVLIGLRTVGGISTALTFILGDGLAAAICPMQNLRRRGTLVGLYAARDVPEPIGGSMAVLKVHELRQLAPTFVGYGLFGAGYVGYVTFIIAPESRRQQRTDDLVLVCSRACFGRIYSAVGKSSWRFSRRSWAGLGIRDGHAGRSACSCLPWSDSDVRLPDPFRGQLPGRPDISDHRGAAPIAGLVLDGGHLIF